MHGPLNVKLFYLSESRICFIELPRLPNEILYSVVKVTLFQLLTPCVCITNFLVHSETLSPLQINLLKPNDIYICRTAALTSRRYISNIYSTNIHTEYFKHAA